MNYNLIIQACQAQITANELWCKFAGGEPDEVAILNKWLVMVISECDKTEPNDERIKQLLSLP